MDAGALGSVMLTGAVVVCGLATASAAASVVVRRADLARVGYWLMAAGAVLASSASLVMARALVRLDLSLVYVADTARRGASGPYRLSGLWAGTAGSLLLWATAMSVVTAVSVFLLARRRSTHAPVHLAIAGFVASSTLATSRWVADPFRRLAIPAIDGGGLVPILEHGAMLVHPPLVYLGLTMTMAPFAATVAALVRRELDDDWSRRVRRWSLAAWCVLLAAMAIGAHWAYDELAWGGFWAWDPVENGVLLPWLALTAAVHARRRDRLQLQALFTLGCFVLACLGAVLARSGVTSSVHAFAEARRVGLALAGVGAVLSVMVVVVVWRARLGRRPAERSLVRLNTVGVLGIVVVVLAGTVAPIVLGWFDGRRRVVDGSFFSRTTWPFAVGLLVSLGLDAARRSGERLVAALGGVGVGVVLLLAGATVPVAGLGAAAAMAVVGTTLGVALGRSPLGAGLVHVGVGVVLLAVAGTSLGSDLVSSVREGSRVEVGGYTMDVGAFVSERRPTSVDVLVPVRLAGGGRPSSVLTPRWRVAQPSRLALAVVARRSTVTEDVQLVLARVAPPADAVLVVRIRPFARWLWWGVTIMVAGGVVAVCQRGRRSRGVAGTAPLSGEELLDRVDVVR